MKIAQASVVLTGASGGIGAATGRLLIFEGARVLLVGRSKQNLLRLAAELEARIPNRIRMDALIADVTTAAGRDAIRHAAEMRNVNVLINNAGVSSFGALGSLTDAGITASVETNLLAPMLLTSALLPHLLKQPRALVLNVGSTLGSIGVPGFSTYGASKAGLRGFSEALRRELADTSVGVQYLAPRAVDTGFNDAQAHAFNHATGSHMDKPEHVARAILKMIESEGAEHYLGLSERIAARLNALAPRLLDGAFAKHRKALKALPQTLHAEGEI